MKGKIRQGEANDEKDTTGWSSTREQGALITIVAVGAALRIYQLASESLWLDEIASYLISTKRYDTLGILLELPQNDVHPPLYYFLLKFWTAIFGTSAVGLRSLSTVLGIAAIVAMYLVGRKLFDGEVGLLSASLLALSSMHIYFAQEARMYALMTLLTLGSVYWFVDAVDFVLKDRGHWTDVVPYVLVTAFLGYSHVFGLFIILAEAIYLGSRLFLRALGPEFHEKRLGRLGRWVGVEAAVAGVLSPYLLLLGMRVFEIGRYDTARASWIPIPSIDYGLATIPRYFFYKINSEFGYTVLLALLLAAVGLLLFRRTYQTKTAGTGFRCRGGRGFLILWFVVPILVPFVLSYVLSPIYRIKYTMGASLALFVLVGVGIRSLRSTRIGSARFVLVIFLLVGLTVPLPTLYTTDTKPQWDEAGATINSNTADDAMVLATPGYMGGTVEYYTRTDIPVAAINSDRSRKTVINTVDNKEHVWVAVSSWRAEGDTILKYLQDDHYRVVNQYTYHAVKLYQLKRVDS